MRIHPKQCIPSWHFDTRTVYNHTQLMRKHHDCDLNCDQHQRQEQKSARRQYSIIIELACQLNNNLSIHTKNHHIRMRSEAEPI